MFAFIRSLRPAALVVAATMAAAPAFADSNEFKAGWEAYQRGDYSTALALWQPLAAQGHVEAQYNVGVIYDDGRGVKGDRAVARQWWQKAAEQGHGWAQHNLANLYISGDGVPRDYAESLKWYNTARALGEDIKDNRRQ